VLVTPTFDPITHKVNPDKLTCDQAIVFVLFLRSEVLRHLDDVRECNELINCIVKKFDIKD
jgi:hypothetical protein